MMTNMSLAHRHVATIESPLYERVLGDEWHLVEAEIRRAHLQGERVRGVGNAEVSTGPSLLGKLLCRLLRLPRAGTYAATVDVRRQVSSEVWTRCFGGYHVTTTQMLLRNGVIRERFRWMEFAISVKRCEKSITYDSMAAHFRVGPMAIPLPKLLQPKICARETATAPGNHVDVSVFFPVNTLLISYVGEFIWSHE